MKPLFIILSVCLLSIANPSFAQLSSEPTKFQIGFSNYSYLATQYSYNLQDEIVKETPFASRWGLSATSSIGDHFGLGISMQYRPWQDETVMPMDPRLMIIFVPVEERYQEFSHHLGLIDLYGRWYVQDKRARLRTYVQLGLGAEATLGGRFAYPQSRSEEAQTNQKVDFQFNGLLLSLGLGIQYRLSQNWGLESGLMTYWPGGFAEHPSSLNQYGLQLGIFRMF